MSAPDSKARVLGWDPYLDPNEGDREFRLTYAGPLPAHKDNGKLRERSLHVHAIRKEFHKQLKVLWADHPVTCEINRSGSSVDLVFGSQGCPPLNQVFHRDGFDWLPMVTEENGLICKLDILMLRHSHHGQVLFDVDNRLKTLFDALRMTKSPSELGSGTSSGLTKPNTTEKPFFVLLEDDRLITHLAVTSDTLLEPVPDVSPVAAVRLVVNVTIRPYRVYPENTG